MWEIGHLENIQNWISKLGVWKGQFCVRAGQAIGSCLLPCPGGPSQESQIIACPDWTISCPDSLGRVIQFMLMSGQANPKVEIHDNKHTCPDMHE
jgi:hypothetical protein